MSPRKFAVAPVSGSVETALRRTWLAIGIQLRDVRLARQWPIRRLARRAGVSVAVAYRAEAGEPTSLEAITRLATALGLRVEAQLLDPRRRERQPLRGSDPVHSAMGELEAAHLRALGLPVGLDEPYQHYQFAGRADVVSWDQNHRALLHIENRTRFPDLQALAGAYNAKRAYLGQALAERLGVARWASETHVIVALWSAEVLHALRLRRNSFRSLCPDDPARFAAWWAGTPPTHGASSTLVILDPLASGRQRRFGGLAEAMTVRPRHHGYAAVAAGLMQRA